MLRVVTYCILSAAFGPACWAQANTNAVNPTAASSSMDRLMARPSWATPDRLRGRLDPTSTVTIQAHLPLQNLEAAKAELEAVSDPDSPRYGQYLSTEEFESKYSPSVGELATVQSYLESQGFSITYVPHDRLFLSATATAANVERVFATHLGLYEVRAGELRQAPIEPAQIPAVIASRVSTVLGLHTATVKSTAIIGPAFEAASNTTVPCPDYLGQYFDTNDPPYGGGYPNPTPVYPCGLAPPRVRRTYGLDAAVVGGNDGSGVTIGILLWQRSPTLVADAQQFAATFDPNHPLVGSQISLVDAPSGGGGPMPIDPVAYLEQALDVEAVHSVAPGANIVYVFAATPSIPDLVVALNLIIQDKRVSIVSNSWTDGPDDPGVVDPDVAALDPLIIQAGLKGMGLYFSSGDSGDNQCGINANSCPNTGGSGAPSVFYPVGNPHVTSVGGTSLYLTADNSVAYETGWESGDSLLVGHGSKETWAPVPPGLLFFGAGGGPSHRYAQPNYQQRAVPSSLAGMPPARVAPDVAMLADPDSGMKLGATTLGGTYTVYRNSGGTSQSTPLMAGTMALAEQRAGHRLGFANPLLYRVASQAFRDIAPTPTPQSITHPGVWTDTEDPPNLMVQRPDGTIVPHTLHSAPGFDNVTGLGVPNGEAFLEAVSGK
jgi:subtilase family serine protease